MCEKSASNLRWLRANVPRVGRVYVRGVGAVQGWGLAEEEARTAHSSPTKGALLPGCTAKHTGPFRTSASGASGSLPPEPPPASATHICLQAAPRSMEAWIQQVHAPTKLCNTGMNSHEKTLQVLCAAVVFLWSSLVISHKLTFVPAWGGVTRVETCRRSWMKTVVLMNEGGREGWRSTLTYIIHPSPTQPVAHHALPWDGSRCSSGLTSTIRADLCATCYFTAHTKKLSSLSRLPLSGKNVLLDEGTALCLTNVCVYVYAREWLAVPGQADSAPQQPWLSVFSLCQPTHYCCSHCCQCRLSWVTEIPTTTT